MTIHQPHNSAGGYAYNTVIYDNIHYDPHFHTNFEVIYVFEGRIDAVIGTRPLQLCAGDMALCLSNEIHEYKTVGNSRCWITVFSKNFVPEFQRAVQGKRADRSSLVCSDAIMNFLKENFFKEDTKDHFLISACLNLICGEHLRNARFESKAGKEFSKINQITDYMTENFKNPITLGDAADALGYERCYFSKMFKSIFGVGFNDYLSTLRFWAATDELTNTSRSITDIALDSGFQSVRSFNDVFKKKAGITPLEYRSKTRFTGVHHSD
ncbi:MAG: AraC family transcriptional regulator [Acutalibacteraceae bacterium]|nr:AraC family transcriptional regulator [Acutalibacteraceae bacterium]